MIYLLSIYFIIAWAIEQYFKARVYIEQSPTPIPLGGATGFLLNIIYKYFQGLDLANNSDSIIPINETIKKLFSEGYEIGGMNVKYWDVIKVGAMMLVFAEMIRFNDLSKSTGSKPSEFTYAVFGLMIFGMGLVTLPKFTNQIRMAMSR